MNSASMLLVEEAQKIVLSAVTRLGVERIVISHALHRVLAEDIAPGYDIPPHDNSSVDGYAVRAGDVRAASSSTPCRLDVQEDIPAGTVPEKGLSAGQASRIMTGGMVPEGADAVVMIENTSDANEQHVNIMKPVTSGQNVRYRGEDVRTGETVLRAGTVLGPGEIGLLASFQRSFLTVFRQPTVAILSTGDEVVEIDEPLTRGKILNSNSYSLAGIVGDTEEAIREAIESMMHVDIILSTGGVSVGDYDYVKKVLVDLGADMKFWKVRMKPGKPLAFGVLNGIPFFGLPGNPVSCMVSFLLFVRPALRKIMGYEDLFLPIVQAQLGNDVNAGGDRRHYLRAHVSFEGGTFQATTVTGQGSGMLSSMAGTNGLVIVETGTTSILRGKIVSVLLMRPAF